MATVELEIYSCLCATSTFSVNNIEADSDDFGDKGDNSPDEAEPYGCGDMLFTAKPPEKEVLAKYGITTAEYEDIATRLEDKLSFGCCGWCA